ncbi:hypothetical protein ACFXG4_26555 [Nocardia sp. NPDC059246]|uniref:hypothetical protein n=1 Tax=unclassified Nocardia TaxID=2637762 RepID=UPI003675515B
MILTDEQSGWGGDPGSAMPKEVPLYTWNLAGYRMVTLRVARTGTPSVVSRTRASP